MRNMIFSSVWQKMSSLHLTETLANASDNNRLLNNSRNKEIVYSVSEYFLKNKEDSRTYMYLERPAIATGVVWYRTIVITDDGEEGTV